MAGKPFIAKFTEGGRKYIYDVNSNHILNVDEAVFSAIDYWGAAPLRVAVSKLRGTPAREVRRAWREIREYSKKGLFSSARPRGISYGITPLQARRLLDGSMEQLVLGVTERCNQRCVYCVYSGQYTYRRTHSERAMPREVALKAVDYFIEHSRKSTSITIGFYGGEPFLNFPLIQEVVRYARAKEPGARLRFNLTTNLTLLTDAIIEFMVANDVSMLVSMDGPEETHDRYRVFANGHGTHAVVMRNLKKICDAAPEYYSRKIRFSTVLAPQCRITKLHDFVSRHELMKNSGFAVGDIDDRETALLDKLSRAEWEIADYRELVNRYVESVTKNGEAGGTFLEEVVGKKLLRLYKRKIGIKMPHYEHPNGVCLPGLRRLLVTVDGLFHICERINESLVIGDVERGLDYEKIASIMRDYARESSPSCRQCWAVRLCSLCYIHAVTDRLDFAKKAMHCEGHRQGLLNSMALYCRILNENPKALDFMQEYSVS